MAWQGREGNLQITLCSIYNFNTYITHGKQDIVYICIVTNNKDFNQVALFMR